METSSPLTEVREDTREAALLASHQPLSVTFRVDRAAAGERLDLPTMGSLLALLYGVELLFRASPAAAWLECILAGSLLLLGHRVLREGLDAFIYRLRPNGETLLAFGSLVAFFYSFLTTVLHSLGRLAPGHFTTVSTGARMPVLFFTTAGTIITAAHVSRVLLERGERRIAERRDSHWQRLAKGPGSATCDRGGLARRWEVRSPWLVIHDRVGEYACLLVFLLVVLIVTGSFMEPRGLNAAVVAAVLASFVAVSPSVFSLIPRTFQSWASQFAGGQNCLFQTSETVERLAQVSAACFNKLGTLTFGCPQVTDVVSLRSGVSEDELIYLASVLEAQTEHPFKEAILLRVSGSARTIPRVRGFRAIPGRGLRAVFQGQEIVLGAQSYLQELGVDCEPAKEKFEDLCREGKTVLVLAKGGEVHGLIALCDEKRSEAKEAVEGLRKLGVRTAVTSGDAADTVQSVADDMGIDEIHAGLSQSQCIDIIHELQARGHRVAMVAGGVANASTLAQADVGVAFGLGQEGLLQSADVVLAGHDLREIPRMIRLARKVRNWTLAAVLSLATVQCAVVGTVIALWLQYSLAADGTAVWDRLSRAWIGPYWPDLLGVVAALAPAGIVWLGCLATRWRPLEPVETEQPADRRLLETGL